MATRLINDKGIFEYLELADLMKESDFEFYLAGDIDNGNPDSLSKSQLDEIKNLDKNRPLRLSLSGVFSELPVPPFVVKEWRSLN